MNIETEEGVKDLTSEIVTDKTKTNWLLIGVVGVIVLYLVGSGPVKKTIKKTEKILKK